MGKLCQRLADARLPLRVDETLQQVGIYYRVLPRCHLFQAVDERVVFDAKQSVVELPAQDGTKQGRPDRRAQAAGELQAGCRLPELFGVENALNDGCEHR